MITDNFRPTRQHIVRPFLAWAPIFTRKVPLSDTPRPVGKEDGVSEQGGMKVREVVGVESGQDPLQEAEGGRGERGPVCEDELVAVGATTGDGQLPGDPAVTGGVLEVDEDEVDGPPDGQEAHDVAEGVRTGEHDGDVSAGRVGEVQAPGDVDGGHLSEGHPRPERVLGVDDAIPGACESGT